MKMFGNKLKGYYTLKSEPGSMLWDFSSSELPGETNKESITFYFKDGSSFKMDKNKFMNMAEGSLPIEIKFREKDYKISSTKNGGLIMNKAQA
jgi:hypothetical protein